MTVHLFAALDVISQPEDEDIDPESIAFGIMEQLVYDSDLMPLPTPKLH
jgi:hypothetical protein